VCSILIEIGNDDLGTLVGELPGHGSPDTGAPTRHDRDFSFQAKFHRFLPFPYSNTLAKRVAEARRLVNDRNAYYYKLRSLSAYQIRNSTEANGPEMSPLLTGKHRS
jgi:hypothetical protein